jgi:hypothetical protein
VSVAINTRAPQTKSLTTKHVHVSVLLRKNVQAFRGSIVPHVNVNVLQNHTAIRDVGSTHTPVSVSAAILLRVTINTPSLRVTRTRSSTQPSLRHL